MSNVKLRQAVAVALDMQPIMQATFGNPGPLQRSIRACIRRARRGTRPRARTWYNVHNTDRAKPLAKEAGY